MTKSFTIKTLAIIILILMSKIGFSQKNCEKGDKYFNQNLFEDAIKYYQLDIKSKNRKASERAMQKLADCYRITGEFEKAEETYKKILKRKKKDPVNYLNYGLSLKSSAKYAEAILQFQEYITLKPEDPMGKIFMRSCDSAQKWLDETIGKEVKNLEKINTELSEFSPVFYLGERVYFSSSRLGSKRALISFDGGGEIHRTDLYTINLDVIENKETLKTDIANFKEINTPLHEGSACFSSDGKELYFTKTIKGKRDKKTNNILNTLQVFYSHIDSTGKWSVPKSAFFFNSMDYSIGQPSLSKDGNTIFFMSDKPGGFGKTDIYYSIKPTNGKWGNPINAGKEINTFGHELFPYISETGELYFSSNSHPGMGQLDVFKATLENGKWVNIQNLKPPINSIGNDFGIAYDGKNQRGFFSSDRFNGKGAEDIYSFSEEIPLNLTLKNDTLQFKDASVFDDIKYKVTIEMNESEMDLVLNKGVYNLKLNKTFQYKIIAKKNGLPYNTIKFSYATDSISNDIEIKLNTSSKTISLDGYAPVNSLSNSIEKKTVTKEISIIADDHIETAQKCDVNQSGYFKIGYEILPEKQYIIRSNTVITDQVRAN